MYFFSLNCDEETFLSSDDLRINIWNLEMPTQAFNVVDIKPEVMEDLNEVITSAKCHPCHCHLFIHSSSKGIVRVSYFLDYGIKCKVFSSCVICGHLPCVIVQHLTLNSLTCPIVLFSPKSFLLYQTLSFLRQVNIY
jgi:hypothetical protein